MATIRSSRWGSRGQGSRNSRCDGAGRRRANRGGEVVWSVARAGEWLMVDCTRRRWRTWRRRRRKPRRPAMAWRGARTHDPTGDGRTKQGEHHIAAVAGWGLRSFLSTALPPRADPGGVRGSVHRPATTTTRRRPESVLSVGADCVGGHIPSTSSLAAAASFAGDKHRDRAFQRQ